MAVRIFRVNWFTLADANRALEEYYDAFGTINGFYLRGTEKGEREDEANYATVIRKAIRRGETMTDEEIELMYGLFYEEGADY